MNVHFYIHEIIFCFHRHFCLLRTSPMSVGHQWNDATVITGYYRNRYLFQCTKFETYNNVHQHIFVITLSIVINWTLLVGLYIPIANALGCEASVLCSIDSSDEIIWCIMWTDNMLWPGRHYGLGCLIHHESQDLITVGQHDLRIKEFN